MTKTELRARLVKTMSFLQEEIYWETCPALTEKMQAHVTAIDGELGYPTLYQSIRWIQKADRLKEERGVDYVPCHR